MNFVKFLRTPFLLLRATSFGQGSKYLPAVYCIQYIICLFFILDINECDAKNPCFQICANTIGSFQCLCENGYTFVNDSLCTDNNECTDGTNNCDPNANCTNILGSFLCACNDGFRGDGKTCVGE